MSEIIPIPTRKLHGNKHYPLTEDYWKLVETEPETARRLRVNACRQWLIKREVIVKILADTIENWGTFSNDQKLRLVAEYRADAYVASLKFLDEYYLKPDESVEFDPLFYDEEPLPTPEYHWDMARTWAIESASIEVAPRGGAKSMFVRKNCILRMLTKSSYKILYCTSSEKNATESAQLVRSQCYSNKRIQEDFGPEMPDGRIKPRKGDAPTGIEWFQLANGSQLVTYSVNSKMRGGRPRWFVLDDPEYDPHDSTSMESRRTYMYRLIMKVAMPMIQRRNASISWLATFVSKRHFAWMAMETERVEFDGKIVERAKVPEFEYWSRRIIKACWEDENGELQSCWPQMWPVNEQQKKDLQLDPSTPTLQQIKLKVGPAVFNSEYMANPGGVEETYFKIDERKHGYVFLANTVDENTYKDPWRSETIIRWWVGEAERQMKLCDFLATLRLFITVDTSKTATAQSDYKVATLMGINEEHDLFVLDMFAKKCQPEKLITATLEMAMKWKCRRIAPELIDDGIVIERTLKNMVTRMAKSIDYNLLPIVKGFNPGYTKKSVKIGALIMRFEHGKIKLPMQRKMTSPWMELFAQCDGFNPEVPDGGLSNDDHLDTVSMSEYVIGTRIHKAGEDKAEDRDPLKMILSGKMYLEDGTPVVQFIDLQSLTPDQASDLMRAVASRKTTQESLV